MADSSLLRLSWGVKQSLLAYVRGAGGSVAVHCPAQDHGASFRFPLLQRRDEDLTTIWEFDGSVLLSAHGGTLNVLLAHPWLHVGGGDSVLTVAGTEETRTLGRRVTFARVDLAREVMNDATTVTAPARLHSEAAVFFDFRYEAGTELDPVSIDSQAADAV